MLTVIIPFFNEEKTIIESINRVLDVSIVSEIIAINDGSSDKSLELVQAKQMETDKLIILNNEKNQGKGSALRLAKNKISNKYIVIHDADLEYFPNDFIQMFEIISKNENSFVAGSRFLKKNPYSYFRTFLANVIFSKLFSILYKMKVSDVSTCYKMMGAEFYKELDFKKNGFDIEIELVSTCVAKKLNYFEVPIDYSPRSYEDGKKISLVDGFKYIYSILDYRFKIN